MTTTSAGPSSRSAYHGDGLNAATRSGGDLLAALTATRNGEEIDLSGTSASATRQSPMMAARAGAEAARQARISHVNPSENFTGADMGLVAATPRTSFVSDRERKAAERAAEEAANGPAKDYAGLGEWLRDKDTLPGPVRMSIDEQWIATNVLRQLGQESHAPDPNFRFNDELWKELTGGLPPEYTEVMDEAVSEGHARTLAAMARQSYERDRKLGSLGVTGIGLQLGASILDPVSILATVATEGTLGPAIYGAKVSRMGRFLRAGAAGAAVNAGLDSYLISQDPVGQWSDLAYSAVGGFVLGGAVGAFKSSPADPEMRKLFKGWIRQADEAETVAEGGVTQGSVGAAKVPGTHLTDAEALAAKFEDTPFSAFGAARIDRTGRLMQSQNGVTRAVAESLGEDGVGRADGSVSRIAADEKAARDIRTTETRFFKSYNPAFKAWAKENGMRAQSLYDPSVRAKFNWEVGKAVRRPEDATGNAHVQAVASTVRQEFARLHKFGVEHNIPGFKEFGSNDTYLTRQYRIQAMDDLVEKWGRGNSRVIVQRMLDNAHGKRRINMRRLRSLGISEEMAERVNKQIRSHMDTADGILGRKAKRINIDAWTDVDAKNAFINGVDRWSRRSIQENNPGNMPAWMTTEMGKTVGQFRSFIIAAYTKQLLNGMHMRDMETFSTWAASMFFGGLFYVGQQHVNAIGRPDAEKWLEKRLSPAEIGKAAFQRAGFSTFLPGIIDTAAIPFVDEPVFAYRNSGLASNVFGNPTMDLLSTAHDALNGAASAAAQSDYDFSQQDWRKLTSLLPLQNAFVIRNGLAAMGGGLPRWSR